MSAAGTSKDNPFSAVITEARLLNKPGSEKETKHFVVNIAGSGLRYTSGDSLGVWPTNAPGEVGEILQRLGADGDEPVAVPRLEGPVPLRDALSRRLALAGPTKKMVESLAGLAADPAEAARLKGLLDPEAKEVLADFLRQREFVDLLAEFPSARPTPQGFVDHLRRLVPRLYSVASSGVVFPEEVHLTVSVVRYQTNGRRRVGVCSGYLGDRVQVGVTAVPVFVSASHFRLPADGGKDAIMVGPGTGIAPFRAFVQERGAAGASGRNWLFFGDQHRATDFLYEAEWKEAMARGRLARLDTAFSRDQKTKIYVQDRMREHAAELWRWLQGGAHFYVCGDARRMAKDVDTALHDIVAEQGRMPTEAAAAYVKQMKRESRYQRDVY